MLSEYEQIVRRLSREKWCYRANETPYRFHYWFNIAANTRKRLVANGYRVCDEGEEGLVLVYEYRVTI